MKWKELLSKNLPLLLPSAHDALTAKLIEDAGFPAYQIGGFALVGSLHGVPDVELEHYGEKKAAAERIIRASSLPVMVDCDDGYGDAKNVTRTVVEYIALGVSAIFIEDQRPPKKCGHMSDKHLIPPFEMVNKIAAAVEARGDADLFILARTDAIGSEGLKAAIYRAERYLAAGADGVYLEGAEDEDQLQTIGDTFRDIPLAISVLEGGGKTPVLSPDRFVKMGFDMILYPTTIIFQTTYAIQRALLRLKSGMEMEKGVMMDEFEHIVDIDYWSKIEKKYSPH